jgi:hypothetical protein
MAIVGLFAAMLVIMLMRVALPIGVRIAGQPLGKITLSLGERVRLQRTNVYAIGAVMVVGALLRELPPLLELVAIVGVGAILAIPVRYVLTTEGIALNRVVFRPWSDFERVDRAPGRVTLIGRSGLRPFRLVVGPASSEVALPIIRRFLPEQPKRPAPRRSPGVLRRA